MAFSNNLARIRRNNYDGTIKEFAEKVLRIPYTTYYGYENRDTLPPEEIILKIASALGVTIDELFGYNRQFKDIGSTIKTLEKNYGIKAIINKESKMIEIYANNMIGSIPEDIFLDIVKTCRLNACLKYDRMLEDIIYAMIMRATIFYAQHGLDDGSKDYQKKKKAAKVTVDLSPVESSEVL